MTTSHCISCGAEIIWAKKKDGRPIPLEPASRLVAVTIRTPEGLLVDRFASGHEPHHAVCPSAAQHRKGAPSRDQLALFEAPPGPERFVEEDRDEVRRFGHRRPQPQEYRK